MNAGPELKRSRAQIGQLQERAARAVPGAIQEMRGGCWLRHTDSDSTWWAGAALMHGDVRGREVASGIAVVEDFYVAHGAPARFQVCPACPSDLDEALSVRGYQAGETVFLQVATAEHIKDHLCPPALHVDLTDRLDVSWLHLLLAAQDPGADPAPEWRRLRHVDRPSAYATAFVGGRPVAVGRAVLDTGWAGVFSMGTLPGARGHGAGRAVLWALADWAARTGGARLYLQVTRDSSDALRLYRRAGFQEVCTYHYRTAHDP